MSGSQKLGKMSTPHVISAAGKIHQTHSEPSTSNESHASPLSMDAPTWLTQDYLERCLRRHHSDGQLQICNVQARPALGKGENYGGVLTRIKADFRTCNGIVQTGHYIVKSSFEGDEFASKLMEPYDMFNREMSIYENVLPKLKALLQQIGESEAIFAETIAVDYERSALIFEDLSARDYIMPDRIEGLDMPLTKLVLRKLAKMHAASAVLNERERGSLESYDRGMYNRYTNNYAPCYVGLLEACGRLVSQWQGYEQYGEQLAQLKPMHMELGKRVFDVTTGHLNVLAHGDLWTNNVLVKYDAKSGAPLDVIIIDFQYSAWGSPAIDVLYLFNTSLQEQMHLHQQDELIQFYYYNLAHTLRRLTYKANIPSLHRFHVQLEQKAYYAFTSTCIIQPVQRMVETEDADFNGLMKTDERGLRFKNSCYKNPYCQRIIRQLLPVYARKGLLELEQ